ncbi:MAG: hypothetical protein ACRD1K_03865 [Acidimicrobiales bacterium]
MALSNRDRVGRAFEVLATGLAPLCRPSNEGVDSVGAGLGPGVRRLGFAPDPRTVLDRRPQLPPATGHPDAETLLTQPAAGLKPWSEVIVPTTTWLG